MDTILIGGVLAALLALSGCDRPDEALREMEAIKIRACACGRDADPAACLAKIREDLWTVARKHEHTEGSQSQVARMKELVGEVTECMTKAAEAGAGAAGK